MLARYFPDRVNSETADDGMDDVDPIQDGSSEAGTSAINDSTSRKKNSKFRYLPAF